MSKNGDKQRWWFKGDGILGNIGNIGSLWGCQRRWLKPHEAVFSQEVPHPLVRQKAEPRLPDAAANAKALKIYRKKHRSKSIHRFSRETGHNFSNGLSFNYKETSVIVSLKLKLTTKKCYVLSEKIFFEFRISNFMIYRTIPCLILPRWHRIASLQLWLCTSATQTNEYLYVCNRDAENCHKLPRSMAARLTTSREENVILINRYEADT